MSSMFVWIDGLHALLQNNTHLADGEKGLERAITRKIEYQSVNVVIGRTKLSTSKKPLHILTAVVCILTAVCCRGRSSFDLRSVTFPTKHLIPTA